VPQLPRDPFLEVLDRIGCGGIILGASGQPLLSNLTARRVLQQETGPANLHPDNPDWIHGAIKSLYRKRTRTTKDDAWVTIAREEGRPLVVHEVPIPGADEPGARTLLMLIDVDATPEPNPTVLQKLFDLTSGEAKLAIQVARGHCPTDIAHEHGVSITTVRSQLAAVFAKTQTRRQAELMALLARVSLLS
jgi:DNA-binding CsgD family transcriptional regulator